MIVLIDLQYSVKAYSFCTAAVPDDILVFNKDNIITRLFNTL